VYVRVLNPVVFVIMANHSVSFGCRLEVAVTQSTMSSGVSIVFTRYLQLKGGRGRSKTRWKQCQWRQWICMRRYHIRIWRSRVSTPDGSTVPRGAEEFHQSSDVEDRQRLRSAAPLSLVGRRALYLYHRRSSFSGRRFRTMDTLPQNVTSAPSLTVVRKRLKTSL